MDGKAERGGRGVRDVDVGKLWLGVVAAPVAWFLHLVTSYGLVRYACRADAIWTMHGATLLALALATTGGAVAWRNWHSLGRPRETAGPGAEGRSQLLAVAGLATTAFFLLLILAAGMPNFFITPCT